MQESLPLITIIVPMYNVELYIERCISSIQEQTYRNIEILLVDDGSPDKSGQLADEKARSDARTKVFHVKNGGVSAARNLGIQHSTGEFVVFVDGDDYLAPDYVDYMYGLVGKTNAEFVMSRNCFKFPGDEKQVEIDRVEVLSSDRAAAELLYPENIDIGCWNKMFSREFIQSNGITFPSKYFMGEGLNFIVRAAQLAACVGIGQRRVYYYRRDNLNSATTALSAEKYINALAAIDNIEKTAVLDTPSFTQALEVHRYFTTFAALKTMLMTNEKNYSKEYKSYLSYLRKNAVRTVTARISFLKKVRMWMYCLNPRLAHRFCSLLIMAKRTSRVECEN
jgi:glycosyltransferase involved in cell wall biosynthesis